MQNVVDFGTTLQKINVMKSVFNPPSVSTFSLGALEISYILGSFYTIFRISVETYKRLTICGRAYAVCSSIGMVNLLVYLNSFMI
jgi:hypothetical protein